MAHVMGDAKRRDPMSKSLLATIGIYVPIVNDAAHLYRSLVM